MILRSTLLVSVLASTLWAAQVPQRVERRYEVKGIAIEGLGACSESPEKIRCWDMDGADAPDLAELVTAQYLVQPSLSIDHQFGKKNRLLVVRKTGGSNWMVNSDYASGSWPRFTITGDQESTEFIRVASEPGATMGEVKYQIKDAASVVTANLPAKKDATVEVLGSKFAFDSFKKSDRQIYMGGPFGPRLGGGLVHRVVLKRLAGMSRFPDTIELLGEDMQPIRLVDAKGKPVKMPPDSSRYFPAQKDSVGLSVNELLIDTNVSPQNIKYIRLGVLPSFDLTLTGFPLDPKEKR